MLIGYARVSTRKQRLDLQLKALEAAKCNLMITERLSGGAGIGRGLLAAIGSCYRGDTLVVWKLDRMSRNLRELLSVLDVLTTKGIALKVLTGAGSAIDLTQVEGPAIYAAYAAFAELERHSNRERTLAGIKARSDDRRRTPNIAATRPVGTEHAYRRPLRWCFNRIGSQHDL